jgi:DNA repair protein RadA/Sms
MKQARTAFVCQECGSQAPKWMGRCPDCGAWNSFVEERVAEAPTKGAVGAEARYGLSSSGSDARRWAEIDTVATARLTSGISEFDRVLGGGIVAG